MPELKVVLLGVPSVGKTSLFHRFVNDDFTGLEAPTMPSDCCGRRQLVTGGQSGLTGPAADATIVLWDTAGEERFYDFNTLYYGGSSAAVVCFDLADYTTLLKSSFWISDLTMRLPNAALFLCGCKSDLLLSMSGAARDDRATNVGSGEDKTENDCSLSRRRHVDSEMLKSFARQHSIPQDRLFCVSAKTGHQVTELFEAVAASCLSECRRQSLVLQRQRSQSQLTMTDSSIRQSIKELDSMVQPSNNARDRKISKSFSCCRCM